MNPLIPVPAVLFFTIPLIGILVLLGVVAWIVMDRMKIKLW